MTTSPSVAESTPRTNGSAAGEPLELPAILERMKRAQREHGAPSLEERLEHLDALERAIHAHTDALVAAISRDFGNRSKHETLAAEIFVALHDVRYARSHLRDWMRAEPREVGLAFMPASAEVVPQPLGVVGVISAWNYPILISLGPLIGAISAGNRVMLKPSELAPEVADALAKLLASAFPSDRVAVVTGGPDVGEAFTRLPFDHLVFTGSTRVGRLVMRAAAENLVPVTLELGGKSPAIVGAEIATSTAAEKIMAGKCFNAGQTCVAPDYAMVPKSELSAFASACEAAVAKMYPTLLSNPDYTSIVNDRHYARQSKNIDEAKSRGVKVVEINPARESLVPEKRKLAPTLVLDPPDDLALMQEEIFGPILPIKTYGSLDLAIDYVNDHPRPLALYFMGYDEAETERVLKETISGGVCVNDTMLQVGVSDLPFGGVGASGMGHYHGREGFETFSKKKSVLRQSRVSGTVLLRPPYGRAVELLLKLLIGK